MRSWMTLVMAVSAGACSVFTDLSVLGPATDASVEASSDAGADASSDAGVETGSDASTPLGCGANDAGLVAYWPMEEGQGTNVADCSGNGLNATIIGNGTWVGGRNANTKAIQFDSTFNTYVLAPTSTIADGITTVTVAAWVKLGAGVNSYIIDKGQPPSLSWSFEMEQDNAMSFYVSPDGTNFTLANKAGGPLNAWTHVAAVYEAGVTQTIYVGGLSFVSAAPAAKMFQSTVPMQIGGHTSGAIDELRVYSRALGPAEIAALAADK